MTDIELAKLLLEYELANMPMPLAGYINYPDWLVTLIVKRVHKKMNRKLRKFIEYKLILKP